MGAVPDKSGVTVFLERYLAGKSVTEIAQELGVSREWVSRAYGKEAWLSVGDSSSGLCPLMTVAADSSSIHDYWCSNFATYLIQLSSQEGPNRDC